MEHLENDGKQGWAKKNRVALDVWLDCLAALLLLDDSERYSCSPGSTGRRPLLTGRSAEAEIKHKEFVVRGVQSPGYFCVSASDMSAYFHVTAVSHTYIDYHREQKNLLRRAFVIRCVELLPSSAFVRQKYVEHGGGEWRLSSCV